MRDMPIPDLDDVDITNVMHALSDPVRLAIVGALAEHGEMHCDAIGEAIGIEIGKSTRSHHFGTLREAGLTRARYEGQRKYIWLRREEFDGRFPGLLDSVLGARVPS